MQFSALLEIIIFGLIAFVIISKMLDMLGNVNEDDTINSKSIFGESSKSASSSSDLGLKTRAKLKFISTLAKKIQVDTEKYKGFILDDESSSMLKTISDLEDLIAKMPKFDLANFIENATKAFHITNEALRTNNLRVLSYMVDKRFLNQLKTCQHESLRNAEAKFISAKICEIYSFGNNVFIKILFEMTNDVKEEWAFSKNVLDQNRVWYICSINSVSSK
jgi:predicted lipid-binding transport protein (Tim44 family)